MEFNPPGHIKFAPEFAMVIFRHQADFSAATGWTCLDFQHHRSARLLDTRK